MFSLLQINHIRKLVSLSSAGTSAGQPSSIVAIQIAEVAAGILARIAERQENKITLREVGAIPVLLEWIDNAFADHSRMQEASLDALSSICKENKPFSLEITSYVTHSGENATSIMFKMIRDKRPSMRLSSATCISYLYRIGCLNRELVILVSTVLLPTVIRLFADTSPISSQLGMAVITIQERAATLFSYLVSDNAKLQSAALEGDAIPKLASILDSIRQPGPAKTNNVSVKSSAGDLLFGIISRSSSNDKLFVVS